MISPTLCFACSLLAPQKAAISPTTISYTSPGGLISVEAMLNGGRKTRALIDTGAGTSVMDADLVTELKLQLGDSVVANGSVGSSNVAWVKGAKVSGLGPEAALFPIRVPFKEIAKMIGEPIELVLGYDYLASRSFRIEPQSMKVVFYEGKFPESIKGATVIPFKVVGGRPHIQVSFTLADGRKINTSVVMDTGSTGGLTLGGKVVQENSIPAIPNKFKSQAGVGGIGKIAFADVIEVQLGDLSLGKLEVDMPADSTPKALAKDGLLGMEALKGIRFAVDYPSRHLIIWSNKAN